MANRELSDALQLARMQRVIAKYELNDRNSVMTVEQVCFV